MEIPGFELGPEIGRGALSVVYEATRAGEKVAVKVMNRTSPETTVDLKLRFRREAAATARLDHPALVKIREMGETDGRAYLVMEHVGVETLDKRLGQGAVPEHLLLAVARAVAGALSEVHRHGLLHRDVKPSNIVLGSDGNVRLIDFGLVAEQVPEAASAEVVGTLLYCAPEQSGVLKRVVDGRSDLYSLGVVLFQSATGSVPFCSDDVGELMRLHAVATPADVRQLRPEINPVIAGIIAKLLAKDPDDRYQTAQGLTADLEALVELEAGYRQTGELDLGRRDTPGQQIYEVPFAGRTEELSRLLQLWEGSTSGSGTVVLVEGEGGSGKSRLVRELFRTAADDNVLILAGKCQQADRIPFGPLREAIDAYVDAVLRQPPAEKAATVERIRAAAADVAPLALRLFGALHQLVEGLEDPSAVGAQADEAQFYDAAVHFVAGLCQQHERVILQIDDAQWIDYGTREILKRLGDRVRSIPLLVLCACRSDPASNAAKEKLVADLGDALSDRILLHPLTVDVVRELIASHLGGHQLEAEIVARLAARANGNPFAVGEYVRALLDSGMLRPTAAIWTLAEGDFTDLDLPADVLELVVNRVAALSAEAVGLLQHAAVLGMSFSAEQLASVAGVDRQYLATLLAEANRANLIEKVDRDTFTIVHDRVREALLSRLEPAALQGIHQRVAADLDGRQERSTGHIFALARHYAAGHVDSNPRRVFETSLQAGRTALQDHSNEEAFEFLNTATEVLARHPGDTYDTLGLMEALGLTCARTGRFSQAYECLEHARQEAVTPEDRARIHMHVARVRASEGRTPDAWNEIMQALAALGQRYPRGIVWQLVSMLWYWLLALVLGWTGVGYGRSQGKARLRRELIAELYAMGTINSYLKGSMVLQLQLTIRQLYNAHFLGTCKQNIEAHNLYGIVLALMGQKRGASRCLARSMRMAEQLGDRSMLENTKLHQVWGMQFRGDVVGAERLGLEVYPQALRWLGVWYYSLSVGDIAANYYRRGYHREALRILEAERPKVDRAGNMSIKAILRLLTQSATAALGDLKRAQQSRCEALAILEQVPEEKFPWAHANLHRMYALLATDDIGPEFDEAAQEFLKIRCIDYHSQTGYVLVLYGRLRRFLKATATERRRRRRKVCQALRWFWLIGKEPVNRCHVLVVKAAMARVDRRFGKARRLLKRAERLADIADSPWGVYEVYAERARVARDEGETSLARALGSLGRELAMRHGWRSHAATIQSELELDAARPPEVSRFESTPSSTSGVLSGILSDRHLDALLEVSLLSATQLDPAGYARATLDELVGLFGADRGFLFTGRNDRMLLTAGRDADKADVLDVTDFSSTVVEQVAGTRAPIVVTGTPGGELVTSESVVTHGLRSIMAAPLLLRNELVGVAYVDSRVAKGMFKQEDAQIFSAIANHIAIAMETARATQLEIAGKELQKDMALTAAVQSFFLPKKVCHRGVRTKVCGFYRPASQCGGDWWWHDHRGGSTLAVLVGDVTGHGPASAMVTGATATCYRLLSKIDAERPLASILESLNRELLALCEGQFTMTLSAVELDEETGELVWLSAGAPPVLIMRNSGAIEVLVTPSTPLGNEVFMLKTTDRRLEPGERVFLFTDGAPELTLRRDRQFGMARLRRLFAATRGMEVEEARTAIVEGLDAAREGIDQDDDITFVLVDLLDGMPGVAIR